MTWGSPPFYLECWWDSCQIPEHVYNSIPSQSVVASTLEIKIFLPIGFRK